MFNVFVTDAFVSKGYDGDVALRYSNNATAVRFRIGKKMYDPHAENNTRWNNIAVKAFGSVCDRIKKMKIKEGSRIHIIGRLDMEEWLDKKTGESKSQWVIIVDDIEYGYSGSGKTKDSQDDGFQNPGGERQQSAIPEANSAMMQGYQVAPPQAQQTFTNGQQTDMPQTATLFENQYAAQPQMPMQASQQMQSSNPMMSANFTGFEAYGDNQFFQQG